MVIHQSPRMNKWNDHCGWVKIVNSDFWILCYIIRVTLLLLSGPNYRIQMCKVTWMIQFFSFAHTWTWINNAASYSNHIVTEQQWQWRGKSLLCQREFSTGGCGWKVRKARCPMRFRRFHRQPCWTPGNKPQAIGLAVS